MAKSEAAKAVAQDILKEVGAGRIPKKTQIQKKHGYSDESARSGKALQTETYKAEIAPVLEAMVEERRRAIELMKKRISKAKYRDLIDAMDKLTKNIQLLSGGSTENTAIVVNIAASIASKHAIDPAPRGGRER